MFVQRTYVLRNRSLICVLLPREIFRFCFKHFYEAGSMRVLTATRENLTAAKCHINCENCVSGSFVKDVMVNSLWRIATLTFLGIPFMLSEMTIDKWLRLCMFEHLMPSHLINMPKCVFWNASSPNQQREEAIQ